MGRLVEIARFYDPEEMICAQSYLRALGVETFAENESLLNVAPYLRMAVGGYALHAPASLAEDARSALAAAQAVDITEPSAAEGDVRPLRNWIWMPVAVMSGVPFLPRFRSRATLAMQALLAIVLIGMWVWTSEP
jgi:hypothetical protein